MKKLIIGITILILLIFSVEKLNAFEVSDFEPNIESKYDDYIELSTGTLVPVDYEDPFEIGFKFGKYYIDGLTEEELEEIQVIQDKESQDYIKEQGKIKSNGSGEWSYKSFYNKRLKEYYNTKRTFKYSGYTTGSNVYFTWQQPYMYYTYDGKITYCMEVNLGLSGNGWTTNNSGSGNAYNSLNTKQKQAINDYAFFGTTKAQDYKDTGSSTYDYRMYYVATQILIWEVTNNVTTFSTSSLASNNPDTTIGTYKTGITNYMNTNENPPSFANLEKSSSLQTHTLTWNSSKNRYEVTLTDKNKVWDSNFAWYGTYGNYKFENPSGANNVTISTTARITTGGTWNKSKISSFSYDPYKLATGSPTYVNGSGSGNDKNQDLVTANGLGDPINIKFATTTQLKEDGKLKIVKKNQDGELISGVKFAIYNKDTNNQTNTCTTNSSGYCTISNLPYGRYYIREVSTSNPDIILDTSTKTYFNIYNSIQVTKTIVNQQVKVNVDVYKKNQYGEKVSGVKYGIYDKNNSNKLIKTCVTNSSGYCRISSLGVGNYYLQEISSTNPDIIISPTKYNINVSKTTSNVDKTLTYNITNQQIRGDVNIFKTDQANKVISGVKFGLYKSDNTYLKSCTTDSSGKCSFIDLNGGSYYVKELSVPSDDITLLTTKYSFTIKQPSQIVNINNGKVVNTKWAEITIDEVYSEMGNTQIGIGLKADNNYIVSGSKLKVNVLENNNVVGSKTIDVTASEIISGTWYKYLVVDVPLGTNTQNLSIELENVSTAKYSFENTHITGYITSNSNVSKKKDYI